jgi:hypothetical protein
MGERPDRALPPPPAPGTGLEPGDGVDRFARTWSRALRGATYLPMPPVERAAFFLGLSRRLAAAVRGRADSGSRPEGGAGVDVGAVQSVGAALVDAHYTMPEVLGRTVSTRSISRPPPRCAVIYCLSRTAAPSWNCPGWNCSPLRA